MKLRLLEARVVERVQRGNYVSEWFGHRLYPLVTKQPEALEDQKEKRCPFLSLALAESRQCIKPPGSSGICTISSLSNGPRQDWIVCPYRAVDRSLLETAIRYLFGVPQGKEILIAAGPALLREEIRQAASRVLVDDVRFFVYLQDKLGGEVSIRATPKSPEVAFDITIAEIIAQDGGFAIGLFGILEVQTMDFHGSYRYVVKNLEDALRLHGDTFPKMVDNNRNWISDHIEGPNIANVFKRTFYQIMLKFQIGAHDGSAGCVLALPVSVWDSWQRHLGAPALDPREDDTLALAAPGRSFPPGSSVPAWILIFDIEASDQISPNSLRTRKIIATDADSISHYALKVAPELAVAESGSATGIQSIIRRRLSSWWPALIAS